MKATAVCMMGTRESSLYTIEVREVMFLSGWYEFRSWKFRIKWFSGVFVQRVVIFEQLFKTTFVTISFSLFIGQKQ